jgi:CAAX protease family protein
MTARASFVDRAKPVGGALGWLLLFAAVGVSVTVGLAEAVPGLGGPEWQVARQGGYEVVGFLAATLVVGRLLNRRSWEWMGWPRRGLARALARGIGLGGLMAGVAVGLALTVNRAALSVTPEWSHWLAAALPLGVGLLLAALGEELVFRGYALRRLADAVGPGAALLVLSGGFAAVHLGNPDIGGLALLNIFLAGVWLSVAFFSPGRMPLCWGLHFGWNAGLSLIFDAPVSGITFRTPAVQYTPGRHAWVDGGPFGPEGGIVATIVLVLGTAALLGARVARRREWLAA